MRTALSWYILALAVAMCLPRYRVTGEVSVCEAVCRDLLIYDEPASCDTQSRHSDYVSFLQSRRSKIIVQFEHVEQPHSTALVVGTNRSWYPLRLRNESLTPSTVRNNDTHVDSSHASVGNTSLDATSLSVVSKLPHASAARPLAAVPSPAPAVTPPGVASTARSQFRLHLLKESLARGTKQSKNLHLNSRHEQRSNITFDPQKSNRSVITESLFSTPRPLQAFTPRMLAAAPAPMVLPPRFAGTESLPQGALDGKDLHGNRSHATSRNIMYGGQENNRSVEIRPLLTSPKQLSSVGALAAAPPRAPTVFQPLVARTISAAQTLAAGVSVPPSVTFGDIAKAVAAMAAESTAEAGEVAFDHSLALFGALPPKPNSSTLPEEEDIITPAALGAVVGVVVGAAVGV